LPGGECPTDATSPEHDSKDVVPPTVSPDEPETLGEARQQFWNLQCNIGPNADRTKILAVISNLQSTNNWTTLPAKHKQRVGCVSGSAVFAENTLSSSFSIANKMMGSAAQLIVNQCSTGQTVRGRANGVWEYSGIIVHVHGDNC
jgi:hypothetical protein